MHLNVNNLYEVDILKEVPLPWVILQQRLVHNTHQVIHEYLHAPSST